MTDAEVHGTQYAIGAAAVLLLYDTVLTLPTEVNLIWNARWSLVKVLYFALRYPSVSLMITIICVMGGFSPPLSDNSCRVYISFLTLYTVLGAWGIGSILVALRVYAIYVGRLPYVGLLLGALWLLAWVPAVVVMSLTSQVWVNEPGAVAYIPVINSCGIPGHPQYVWVLWPWTIIFQGAICGLLAWRVWRSPDKMTYRGPSLMSCLLFDGICYNVVILVMEAINLIAFLILPSALFTIAFTAEWALQVILISRMYLNLRDVANHDQWTKATDLAPTPMSENTTTGPTFELMRSSSEWSY